MRHIITTIAAICLLAGCEQAVTQKTGPSSGHTRPNGARWEQPLQDTLRTLGYAPASVWLQAHKAQRRLEIMCGQQVVRAYPMVLGFDPVCDKRREGDGCTPEGEFRIRAKYPHRSWKYFLWIDYPTAESYRLHKEAKAAGKIPKEATVGGEVGIHGVPSGQDDLIREGVDWTLGCLSLTNRDVADLYPVVQVGTRIVILP
ncbi:MAG: L,D-transpeptidase [Bacteroidetes bacterium]|nr:L,D-transpeptidase [Bacteroidota bacterium]